MAVGPDRKACTRKVVEAFGLPELNGKTVLIKPNFNTADPTPGSTHNDTLESMVRIVQQSGPKSLMVGDRSGPANTREVFQEKGIFAMADRLGFDTVIFDEIPKSLFARISPPGSHWRDGFMIARPVLEADVVVTLCCLKTHGFGGHFTMSLKVTTGMVAGSNMRELHSSDHIREMIAEMNVAYRPKLIIMDGVEAFVDGGPMTGTRWQANTTLASDDRVAMDAVGVAALKMHGTTKAIESKRIFEQDQIRRAVELGIGVSSPEEIELVPVDDASEGLVAKLRDTLFSA
ncbi:MAG TPA: DUF362 domain-containing protein [Methanomassiliicoccales archaeon]